MAMSETAATRMILRTASGSRHELEGTRERPLLPDDASIRAGASTGIVNHELDLEPADAGDTVLVLDF